MPCLNFRSGSLRADPAYRHLLALCGCPHLHDAGAPASSGCQCSVLPGRRVHPRGWWCRQPGELHIPYPARAAPLCSLEGLLPELCAASNCLCEQRMPVSLGITGCVAVSPVSPVCLLCLITLAASSRCSRVLLTRCGTAAPSCWELTLQGRAFSPPASTLRRRFTCFGAARPLILPVPE